MKPLPLAVVLIALAAPAVAAPDGKSCTSDALRYCSKSITVPLMPDAITACLRAHMRELSLACAAAVRSYRAKRH